MASRSATVVATIPFYAETYNSVPGNWTAGHYRGPARLTACGPTGRC